MRHAVSPRQSGECVQGAGWSGGNCQFVEGGKWIPTPAPTPVGSREEPSSGVRGAGGTGVKVRKASLNGS